MSSEYDASAPTFEYQEPPEKTGVHCMVCEGHPKYSNIHDHWAKKHPDEKQDQRHPCHAPCQVCLGLRAMAKVSKNYEEECKLCHKLQRSDNLKGQHDCKKFHCLLCTGDDKGEVWTDYQHKRKHRHAPVKEDCQKHGTPCRVCGHAPKVKGPVRRAKSAKPQSNAVEPV